jgi:hypothetical protein
MHNVSSLSIMSVYLQVNIGNKTLYEEQSAAYNHTLNLLEKNSAVYGLPESPSDLSEEQRDILTDLNVSILMYTSECVADTVTSFSR